MLLLVNNDKKEHFKDNNALKKASCVN